jgi:ligand-binding SRPBCC domain-containing protein
MEQHLKTTGSSLRKQTKRINIGIVYCLLNKKSGVEEYITKEMEQGRFKSFKHEHFFEEENGITTTTDHLSYETPYEIFGKLFDVLFLKRHLRNFILHRNTVL